MIMIIKIRGEEARSHIRLLYTNTKRFGSNSSFYSTERIFKYDALFG